MIDLLQKLIDQLIQDGAEFIDLRFQKNIYNHISLIDGKSRSMLSAIDKGIGIRVFKNGGWGFSFTDKLDQVAITKAMHSAFKIAKDQ